MMKFAFTQVDVFTDSPMRGNPLAVVHAADGLSDAQMQSFARWTNLSETTFLLKPTSPEADYRVRIFTPGGELPFAGHPTLGTCHAWLEQGGVSKAADRVVQQCTYGLVPIRLEGRRTAFAAPPSRRESVDSKLLSSVLRALGIVPSQVRASQWLDNGPKWMGLLLTDADAVLRIEPNHCAEGFGQGRGDGCTRERRCAVRSPRLRSAARRSGRSRHRQFEREPGAVADRRRHRARKLCCRTRHAHGPNRASPHPMRGGHHLGWWEFGHLHSR